MHDLHVIQGPNVTRDAREKIAFFAFHAFVVEDSRFQQNRVNCGACVCEGNVEIRIAGSFCRPQIYFGLWTKTEEVLIVPPHKEVMKYWQYLSAVLKLIPS